MAPTNGSGSAAPGSATRRGRNTIGALLLAAGVCGLFLPFLLSLLMIAVGIAVLDVPLKMRAHRWMLQWTWYQRLARQCNRLVARWIARWGARGG